MQYKPTTEVSGILRKEATMAYWGIGKTMVLRDIDDKAINGGTWNKGKLGYLA